MGTSSSFPMNSVHGSIIDHLTTSFPADFEIVVTHLQLQSLRIFLKLDSLGGVSLFFLTCLKEGHSHI